MENHPLVDYLRNRIKEINNQIDQLKTLQSEIGMALAFEEKLRYDKQQEEKKRDAALRADHMVPVPVEIEHNIAPYNRHKKD